MCLGERQLTAVKYKALKEARAISFDEQLTDSTTFESLFIINLILEVRCLIKI